MKTTVQLLSIQKKRGTQNKDFYNIILQRVISDTRWNPKNKSISLWLAFMNRAQMTSTRTTSRFEVRSPPTPVHHVSPPSPSRSSLFCRSELSGKEGYHEVGPGTIVNLSSLRNEPTKTRVLRNRVRESQVSPRNGRVSGFPNLTRPRKDVSLRS